MKTTIWKFPIEVRGFGIAKFDVPLAAKPLSVQFQQGRLVGWFAVDPTAPKAQGVFHVIPTGESVDLPERAVYMGTVTHLGTLLVFHVFVEVP